MRIKLTFLPVVALCFSSALFGETQDSKVDLNLSKVVETAQDKADAVFEDALAHEDFSILVTALKAAGLSTTLNGNHAMTVFAPTNAAFKKLPEGMMEMLLAPENKEKLIKVLTFHVVHGELRSDKLTTAELKTLNGDAVTVAVTRKKVSIEGAGIITADLPASNGLVHVIDTVLVPEQLLATN